MFYIESVKPVYPISEKERRIKLLKRLKKTKIKKEKEGVKIKTPTVKHIDILV